jgi:hypothetical protein
VIGNVPFADVKLDHRGQKLSLHDYFFAKSIDALKPGGVLALVTSHYTLDKQNSTIREYLAAQADFLGAIRLPSDAFKREGTAVVTDIVFLRKRAAANRHSMLTRIGWDSSRSTIEGTDVPINRYFHATRRWSWAPGAARIRSTGAATALSATATSPSSSARPSAYCRKPHRCWPPAGKNPPLPFHASPNAPPHRRGQLSSSGRRPRHLPDAFGQAEPVVYGGTP